MALPKRHWGNAAQSPGFVPDAACGRSGVREIITTSALAFDVSVSRNTDWYCADCAKAARLALAKESAPKPSDVVWPKPPRTHWGERSGLRYCNHAKIAAPCSPTEFLQMSDLCRKCERGARIRLGCAKQNPIRTDSERYAELRKLVECWQKNLGQAHKDALIQWKHR